MLIRSKTLAAGFLLLGAGMLSPPLSLDAQTAAVADADAVRTLEAAAERYRSLEAICSEFRQVVRNEILGETIRSRGELCQRVDRFEMRFTDPEGDRIVADGTHLWIYLPSTDPGQVFRTSPSEVGGRFDLHSEFLTDPGVRYAPRIEGETEIEGRAVTLLRLNPVGPSPFVTARLWVDDADRLIRRVEITEDEGFVRTLDLTGIRLNPTIPGERFRFEVPPGVQVIPT